MERKTEEDIKLYSNENMDDEIGWMPKDQKLRWSDAI